MMAVVTAWAYMCDRCGHGPWLPRKTGLPKICPKCKNPKWNKPKKSKESDQSK